MASLLNLGLVQCLDEGLPQAINKYLVCLVSYHGKHHLLVSVSVSASVREPGADQTLFSWSVGNLLCSQLVFSVCACMCVC